ncbi:MAG: response regulator transcription factor [Pseudomonadota bacterium]
MSILLIEDENRVADFIRRGLSAEGWNIDHAPDGETGLDHVASETYDLILLDLMLPGIQGQDVCRKLRARKNTTPILMLTALDVAEEKVDGLRVGADDYLAKPFDFDELVARIEALRRRATSYQANKADDLLQSGDICFDRASMEVRVGEQQIDLSKKERDLLVLFLSNIGRVLSRERILNTVWGLNEDPLTNVVDVYVGRIRRKLGPSGDRRIVTMRNVGYRMD